MNYLLTDKLERHFHWHSVHMVLFDISLVQAFTILSQGGLEQKFRVARVLRDHSIPYPSFY